MGRRLIAIRTTCVSVGMDIQLAIVDDRRVPISPAEVKMLQLCNEMRDEAAHITHAAEVLRIGQDETYDLLSSLAVKKLVVEEAAILSPRADRSMHGSTQNIGMIGVITRDRPSQLLESVRSFADNARDFGHRVELVIIDDSSSSDIRAQNRVNLRSIETDLPIRYAGPDERREFCASIVQLGAADRDIVDYALAPAYPGQSAGAARNCLLLDTLGAKVLSADDDIVARPCLHPERGRALCIVGHKSPFDYWFFPSRDAALGWAQWANVDLLSEHDAMLGRTLGECIANIGSEVITDGMCPHFTQVKTSTDFRVEFTLAGKIGDSGRSGSTWVLQLEGDCEKQLASDDGYLATALSSREIAELPRQATIVHNVGCMTGIIGLNNEQLLPPFFPHFSGEDGLFAALIAKAMPRACCGIVPHGIVHNNLLNRSYEPILRNNSALLNSLLGSCRIVSESLSVERRLQFIGEWLRQMTFLHIADLRATIGKATIGATAPALRELERRALSPLVSNLYRTTADAVRGRHCEDFIGDGSLLPREFKQFGEDGWKYLQEEIGRFAALLIEWSAIIASTREARRSQDLRLSKSLGDFDS